MSWPGSGTGGFLRVSADSADEGRSARNGGGLRAAQQHARTSRTTSPHKTPVQAPSHGSPEVRKTFFSAGCREPRLRSDQPVNAPNDTGDGANGASCSNDPSTSHPKHQTPSRQPRDRRSPDALRGRAIDLPAKGVARASSSMIISAPTPDPTPLYRVRDSSYAGDLLITAVTSWISSPGSTGVARSARPMWWPSSGLPNGRQMCC